MAGGAIVLNNLHFELLPVRIGMAIATSRRRSLELAYFGYSIDFMTLYAGDGLMAPDQRIRIGMLHRTEDRWHEALYSMTLCTGSIAAGELVVMRILVATRALVGVACVTGVRGIRKTVLIGFQLCSVALRALHSGMCALQFEIELLMVYYIDAALPHRPFFIGSLMATEAITLKLLLKSMRTFMAIGARFSLHGIKGERRLSFQLQRRNIRLVTGCASRYCMGAFQNEVFIVIEERRRLEGLLVVAGGAIACLVAALMNILVAGNALLI